MIRFAIWAAVSTIDQAEGDSLDNQIKKCRERGKYEKWIDTGLQYVADGYSRTGYVNLSDAEHDIPPLAQLLADMRSNKFDLLILWNYDRFGDLIIMIGTEFRNHKKQLFSLSQPTPIQETYNPYMDDTSTIMQALAPIWQKQRIADLRRKWEAGMPARIKDGLHPNHPPFGYRFIDKEKPAEINPAEALLVKQMAKMLLEGKSLKAIARECNKSGIFPRRTNNWQQSIVSNILENPFYAGTIYWRKVKAVQGKLIPQPLANQTIAEGKHEPMFTKEYWGLVMAELKRRRERNQRIQVKYPLSGLTFCGHCERKVMRGSYAKPKPKRAVLREEDRSCNTFMYDDIFPKIADRIQSESIARAKKKQSRVSSPNRDKEIKDLEDRLERVQQSAELGVFTPPKAAKRVAEIQRELEKIYMEQEAFAEIEAANKDFMETFDDLNDMSEWIQSDDPAIVNTMLHAVIKRILLFKDDIKIEWR